MSIVGQSTSDSKAVLSGNGGFFVILLFDFPLNRTNTANLLFQFFLRMAIRFIDDSVGKLCPDKWTRLI